MDYEDIAFISAEVKVVFLFTCEKCGKRATGDARRVLFDKQDPADAVMRLKMLRKTSHDMPTGWSSYKSERGTEYRCFQCRSN